MANPKHLSNHLPVTNHPLFTESRLRSLYANFDNSKQYNPEGYTANLTAWRYLLQESLQQGYFKDRTMIVVGPQLLDQLILPKHGRPQALKAIIQELVDSKDLVPQSTFMTLDHSFYSRDYSLRGVGNWVLNKSFGWGNHVVDLTHNVKYVWIKEVEDLADNFLRCFETLRYPECLYTRSAARKIIEEKMPELSDDDFNVVSTYIVRDIKKASYARNMFKFASDGVVGAIDEKDEAILSMKQKVEDIEAKVEKISDQITHLRDQAKKFLGEGNRARAKYALKSIKMAEKTQESSLGLLEKLQILLDSIQQSSEQKEVLDTLEDGVDILAAINAQLGGVERVERIMDRIEDGQQEVRNVGDSIAALAPGSSIEESELEDELNELIGDDNSIADLSAKLAQLRVPNDSIEDKPPVEMNEPSTRKEYAS